MSDEVEQEIPFPDCFGAWADLVRGLREEILLSENMDDGVPGAEAGAHAARALALLAAAEQDLKLAHYCAMQGR